MELILFTEREKEEDLFSEDPTFSPTLMMRDPNRSSISLASVLLRLRSLGSGNKEEKTNITVQEYDIGTY